MRNSWLLALFTIAAMACVATESRSTTSTDDESESQSELPQSARPLPSSRLCAGGDKCVQSDRCPTINVAKCGPSSCCLGGTPPLPQALAPVAATAADGTAVPSSTPWPRSALLGHAGMRDINSLHRGAYDA